MCLQEATCGGVSQETAGVGYHVRHRAMLHPADASAVDEPLPHRAAHYACWQAGIVALLATECKGLKANVNAPNQL